MDGDTRGGAALSVKKITGRPIKFAATGEKLSDIEVFYPDRMASRILGMGDILSVIEKAECDHHKRNGKRCLTHCYAEGLGQSLPQNGKRRAAERIHLVRSDQHEPAKAIVVIMIGIMVVDALERLSARRLGRDNGVRRDFENRQRRGVADRRQRVRQQGVVGDQEPRVIGKRNRRDVDGFGLRTARDRQCRTRLDGN